MTGRHVAFQNAGKTTSGFSDFSPCPLPKGAMVQGDVIVPSFLSRWLLVLALLLIGAAPQCAEGGILSRLRTAPLSLDVPPQLLSAGVLRAYLLSALGDGRSGREGQLHKQALPAIGRRSIQLSGYHDLLVQDVSMPVVPGCVGPLRYGLQHHDSWLLQYVRKLF